MYVCGPTVYDNIHIGNARPLVIFDLVYRLLRHFYPEVIYVRNITDVDDKITRRAHEQGITISQLTSHTIKEFNQDIVSLNILSPTYEPYATQHVSEMIDIIKRLIKEGHAYIAEDHVLFSVKSDPKYGHLSQRSIDEMIAGARVEVAPYKQYAGDFVLWKPSPHEDVPGWDSPWGRGRPGWHIECSAMSYKYLGASFDLHGGGHDLVFPHHENESSQTRCFTKQDFMAHTWIHNGMVTVDGQKMSKSLGNFITLKRALCEYPGEVIRYWLLSANYRQPLEWNNANLAQAKSSLARLYLAIRNADVTSSTVEEKEEDMLLDRAQPMIKILANNLNSPEAIAYLHDIASQLNKSANNKERNLLARLLQVSGQFLGILHYDPDVWLQGMDSGVSVSSLSSQQIEHLIAEREQARNNRDFAQADQIRDYLQKHNISIEDTKDKGTLWRRG